MGGLVDGGLNDNIAILNSVDVAVEVGVELGNKKKLKLGRLFAPDFSDS